MFSCNRIERNSVPKGLYQYEVRHDDCCQGISCEGAKAILVNFWGTLLTRTEISEVEREGRRYIMDDEWEGGSTSMFSPVLKFTLFERFSKECLEVSESMEVNGKKTFGYDEPILYKRVV